MTNKEFIDYMVVIGKIQSESIGIHDFCMCDSYLGDRYLKLEKVSGLSSESILMLIESIIIKIEGKKVLEGLDKLIKLIENYDTYIGCKKEKFCKNILRDLIALEHINMDYFRYKSIILNPKEMMIDNKLVKIEPVSMKEPMAYGQEYKWVLKLSKDRYVDMILCKENKHKFISFEEGEQNRNIREYLKKEEEFDLVVIGYYTASYMKAFNSKLKVLLDRKGL